MNATQLLTPLEIAEFMERVRATLPVNSPAAPENAAGTRPDAVGLVECMARLECLKNAITALQARQAIALEELRHAEAHTPEGRDARRAALDALRGERGEDAALPGVRAGVAHEIALARHLSPWQGSAVLGQARRAAADYPVAFAEHCAGRLDERRLARLLKATSHLGEDDRRALDGALGAQISQESERDVTRDARRLGHELDPYASARRWERAREERQVSLAPAPDGMLSLEGMLPLEEGAVVDQALHAYARAARAHGDARTVEQLRADTLADAVIHFVSTFHPGAAKGSADGTVPTPHPEPHRLEVQIVMAESSLFGSDDAPARLVGYGSVPAQVVRDRILRAFAHRHPHDLPVSAGGTHQGKGLSPGAQASLLTLRRLWAAPDGSRLVAMESRARTFPLGLARFIHTSDDTCRSPYCGAPIREIDHVTPHARGGETTAENAQGLCRRCNLDKELPGFATRRVDATHLETVAPTGHRHVVRRPRPVGLTPQLPPRLTDDDFVTLDATLHPRPHAPKAPPLP